MVKKYLPVSDDLLDLLGDDDDNTETCDGEGERWGGGILGFGSNLSTIIEIFGLQVL